MITKTVLDLVSEYNYYVDSVWVFFFFAGWVISPALRPYMIGPMCNPDIQNLLEAFASLKRGLQCNKARSLWVCTRKYFFPKIWGQNTMFDPR